ncbi:hypothetical protein [Micromonospora zhanjiangensis]|uniref:Uncharacterized protein n=1 Tax=Micromonospora zhanjiangensis TaxID=1522057 RepID=A0ABV8KPW6_9ACTN
MRTGQPDISTGFGHLLRSVAIGLAHTVERAIDSGGATARGNAWAAVCADRDRARRQDELR